MNRTPSGLLTREGLAALVHMEEALDLIDQCGEASDVGAHLDLAICRLRDLMGRNGIEIAPRGPEDS